MRNELNIIEKIEAYLSGNMSQSEATEFDKQIAQDADLRQQVELQREIVGGLTRLSLKKSAEQAHRKFKLGKGGLNLGLGSLAVLIIAVATWFFTSQIDSEKTKTLPYNTNENGTELFAEADVFVPSQMFQVEAGKDTVIQTKGGISMVILANTFLDEQGKPATGKIDLEVKEALDALSIVNGGLSTMSGNRLLESGGMFYVNGRQGEESLQINPDQGIYAQIPSNASKPDMQLFDGIRKPDGTIDWVDPRPLETFLTPIEITSLDFYPPEYLEELDKRDYDVQDKEFTDNLSST